MLLRFGQRPLQPVGAGLAFFQGHAAQLFDQLQVAQAGAQAAQGGGDLGVEYGARHRPAAGLERLQVFAAGVHDLEDAGILQQRLEQRRHRGFGGIDQGDVAVDDDLHQGQLREIGALADEFGVHPDEAWAGVFL